MTRLVSGYLVWSALTRCALAGVGNLALLAGDAGSIVKACIPAASLSHLCINFPEPPQVSVDPPMDASGVSPGPSPVPALQRRDGPGLDLCAAHGAVELNVPAAAQPAEGTGLTQAARNLEIGVSDHVADIEVDQDGASPAPVTNPPGLEPLPFKASLLRGWVEQEMLYSFDLIQPIAGASVKAQSLPELQAILLKKVYHPDAQDTWELPRFAKPEGPSPTDVNILARGRAAYALISLSSASDWPQDDAVQVLKERRRVRPDWLLLFNALGKGALAAIEDRVRTPHVEICTQRLISVAPFFHLPEETPRISLDLVFPSQLAHLDLVTALGELRSASCAMRIFRVFILGPARFLLVSDASADWTATMDNVWLQDAANAATRSRSVSDYLAEVRVQGQVGLQDSEMLNMLMQHAVATTWLPLSVAYDPGDLKVRDNSKADVHALHAGRYMDLDIAPGNIPGATA
ncbi:unnamed protein product [Prorocentrum cordatum]|uniref:Uncharacterized protein n=1 Tax=Prorocentrum cordatum TaxID=2364126 RepID=A0ABN9XI17_9DINO|nr:unnamed protein product [Polarella glacialis]